MGLLDEVRAATKAQRPGPVCGVKRICLERPDLADDIAEAVADPTVMFSRLRDILQTRYGVHVNPGALSAHRRGICSCR